MRALKIAAFAAALALGAGALYALPVIRESNGIHFFPDGILAAFIDNGGQVFNVKGFGAIGDGVTDDTAAINSTVTAATIGGTIYFPQGTYLVSGPILLKGGSRYLGAGTGATTIQTLNTAGVGYSIFQSATPATCTGGAGSCDSAPLTNSRGAGCVCTTTGVGGDCQSNTCAGGTLQQQLTIQSMKLLVRRDKSNAIDLTLVGESRIRDVFIARSPASGGGAPVTTTGVLFGDADGTIGGYSNILEDSHVSHLDICTRILPQGNNTHIVNNSFSNFCGVAVQIDSNTLGHKVNATRVIGNLIEGEVTSGVDDHGIGTLIVDNRFEQATPGNMVVLENDGESATIGDNFWAGTGNRLVDNGMPFWGFRTTYGSYATGQLVGTTSEGADNLLPDATLESWANASTLRGWTSVNTANWDTTGFITQEATIKRPIGSFSAKLGDGTNSSRGMATATQIPVDPTRFYTLAFFWTTPAASSAMRECFRLFDSASAVITTGTVISRGPVPAGVNAENFVNSDLPYVAGSNAHCGGTDITPAVAGTLERRVRVLKFPAGTASVRFMIRTSTGTPPNVYVYADDLYFAEGAVAMRPTGHRLTDAGDQVVYGNMSVAPIAAASGNECVQVDTNGKLTSTGVACAASAPQIPFSATMMLLPDTGRMSTDNTATGSLTGNTMVCARFIPSRTLTNATKLAFRVVTGQASANCSMCIYNDAGTTKLADTGVKSCVTGGVDLSTTGLTAFTLTAAVPYWECWTTDITGVTLLGNSSSLSLLNVFTQNQGTVGGTVGGACPSTRGALSNAALSSAVGVASAE